MRYKTNRTWPGKPRADVVLSFVISLVMWLSISLVGATACGPRPSASLSGWVDSVEGDIAVVLVEVGGGGVEAVAVAIDHLPAGVAEGTYLDRGNLAAPDDPVVVRMRARIERLQTRLRRRD